MFSKLLNFVKSLFKRSNPDTITVSLNSASAWPEMMESYLDDIKNQNIEELDFEVKPLSDRDRMIVERNTSCGRELIGKTFYNSDLTSNPYKSVIFNAAIDGTTQLKEAFRLVSEYDNSPVDICNSSLPNIDYENCGYYPSAESKIPSKDLKDKIKDRVAASLVGPYKAEGTNLKVKVSVGNVSPKEIPNTIENVKLCLTKKNSKVDTSTAKITVKKKKVKKKK